MSHGKDTNDKLRDARRADEAHRQELRDEVLDRSDAETDDFGSQDARRKEGEGRL